MGCLLEHLAVPESGFVLSRIPVHTGGHTLPVEGKRTVALSICCFYESCVANAALIFLGQDNSLLSKKIGSKRAAASKETLAVWRLSSLLEGKIIT